MRLRVIRGQSRLPAAERATWPAWLPWALVEQWRAQIERNHYQTLERLNARGGLSPQELWCAAHGHDLRRWRDIGEREAGEWLIGIAGRAEA